MIRRLLKRVVIPFGVLVLLLVVLLLAAPRLLSGARVREMVVQQVVDATGAQVTLGEASVKILPRLAVRLEQGRIAGTGEALAARQGSDFNLVDYEAIVAAIEVRVALWPLLSRRIEVEGVEVALDRLVVTLPDDQLIAEEVVLTVRELHLGIPAPVPTAVRDAPVPPGLLIPDDIFCRAELTVARLTARQARYDDVRVSAELDGRRLVADPIGAGRAGGEITGTAEIDWERDPWGELVFSFATAGVPAGALLEPWAPDIGNKLETVLVGEGRGRCNLKDPQTVQATLDLAGRVGAGEGVLHAAEWLREVRPYLGDRQDLVEVHFKELVHTFRVRNGRYVVEDLFIDGVDTQWRGKGWLGLDGTIDLSLGTRLPSGFTPDLGRWSFMADALRDDEGRVNLDLRLTGRAQKPTVSVDLTQLKEAAGDNVGEVLKEGIGGLLDKWKGR